MLPLLNSFAAISPYKHKHHSITVTVAKGWFEIGSVLSSQITRLQDGSVL